MAKHEVRLLRTLKEALFWDKRDQFAHFSLFLDSRHTGSSRSQAETSNEAISKPNSNESGSPEGGSRSVSEPSSLKKNKIYEAPNGRQSTAISARSQSATSVADEILRPMDEGEGKQPLDTSAFNLKADTPTEK